jgi:hypothetical protein
MANGVNGVREVSGAKFASGQAVWVRLPVGLGVQYDFVAWVVRVLPPAAAGQAPRYELQGPARERYLDVEEGWLSTSRPTAPLLGDGR